MENILKLLNLIHMYLILQLVYC